MTIPSWLLEVKPNSGLNARDVMPIFGIKSKAMLDKLIRQGLFPKADMHHSGESRNHRVWLVSTIISEIKRRSNVAN